MTSDFYQRLVEIDFTPTRHEFWTIRSGRGRRPYLPISSAGRQGRLPLPKGQ